EYLKRFADEKRLLLIAVLDKRGKVVFQNRDLPAEYLPEDASSSTGRRPLTPELFAQLGAAKNIGFVALKRRDGSGAVVIALDPEGLRFWGIKVSIDKAMAELGGGEGQGLSYFMVMDNKGKIIGAAGRLPEPWAEGEMDTAAILAGKRSVASRKVVYLERQLLDIAAPLYLNNQIAGIVRLGLDREGVERILEDNRKNVGILMGFTIFIAFLSLWFLYTNQNRHLAGIVAMERQLEKAERLSALGQLAAGVAHEIRNPLNAISMATQRLKRDFVSADEEKNREFQALTAVIRDEIRRLNGIIEEFLTFSRSRRLEFHDFSVTELLKRIVSLVAEEAAARGITIETDWSDRNPVLPMDVDKLQQALLNFIKNAMESITGGGVISIKVYRERKGWT
ncbi:MAG: hypothetical protein N2Z74_10020, partial [Syntrophales bacterium]|nr:hypothetical protein [Syntrophales bacterium]